MRILALDGTTDLRNFFMAAREAATPPARAFYTARIERLLTPAASAPDMVPTDPQRVFYA